MSQTLLLKAKGLFTNVNELSEIPEGGMTVANNVVVDRDGIVETRRGFAPLTYKFFNAAYRARNFIGYKSELFAHYGTPGSENKFAYYDSSLLILNGTTSSGLATITAISSTTDIRAGMTLTGAGIPADSYVLSVDSPTQITMTQNATASATVAITYAGWRNYTGTFLTPDSSFGRIRGIEANSNLYFVTSEGVKKIDTLDATVVAAGGIKAIQGSAVLTGASGFMLTNTQVAYRVVWGYKDANNNLILGSPSQRIIVANSTGGTRDVNVTIAIPQGITVDHFYQLYRSGMSASSADEPNDEMNLIYEDNPTAGQITAKTLTVLDSTPESLRAGAALYTSPSQEGILQANEIPPFAKDIALFKDTVFYANTRTKQRLFLTMLAVAGTSGVAIGDVITIAGVAYTGAAAENIAANEFLIYTGGTPGQNIDTTMRSLINVINSTTSNTTVYAYYLTDFDDLPGKVLIEERGVGGAAFTATASAHGTAWNPTLPTAGSSVISENDAFKNGISYSKFQQPEAVPITNTFRVGAADKQILRIIPLREALFIFKEDGIYRLTGVAGQFNITLLDNTSTLIASETAVPLNNQVYMFSLQGVVAVSDTGVSVVSRAIERDFLLLFASSFSLIQSEAFAVPYETERKYILFLPTLSTDTNPTQAYTYNTFTNAWTKWLLEKRCGIVAADGNLHLGSGTQNLVNRERKNRNFTDYVDDEYPVTIISSATKVITLNTVANIEVGDLLYQTSLNNSVVLEVDTIGNTITVEDLITWTNGAATIYKAIPVILEYAPATGKNPGLSKHFKEISIFFKDVQFTRLLISFSTELSPNRDSVNFIGFGSAFWGLFPWGSAPWGGEQRALALRTYVPRAKQRCSQLTVRITHREAYSFFSCNGLSLIYDFMSSRVRR